MSAEATQQEATQQEAALHRLVQADATRAYAGVRAPDYVQPLVSLGAVMHVMRGARCVLVELDMRPDSLDGVHVTDLAPYWAELLRQLDAGSTSRSPPDILDCVSHLMRQVAGGLHAEYWQRMRYRRFLVDGPPPGVQALPEYVVGAGHKSYAVADERWSAPGKSWSQYAAHATSARRVQNLRASHSEVDDLVHPHAFT